MVRRLTGETASHSDPPGLGLVCGRLVPLVPQPTWQFLRLVLPADFPLALWSPTLVIIC